MTEYPDKQSITIANIVEQEWLSRYPWPQIITYDQGSEFIGKDFSDMVQNDYGIKVKAITVRNPQANAIVERIHQVIDNMIRTFELEDKDVDQDVWKGIIAATSFAVRSTWHSTLQATPGQLVFGRDTVFAQSFAANWNLIRQRRQRMINYNNRRENSKRIGHTYRRGDKVLITRSGTKEMQSGATST